MRAWMGLLIAGFALAAVAPPAAAQGHDDAAGEAEPGLVVIGNISVPVVQSRRVSYYEYATIGLQVHDTRTQLRPVCDKRFDLADAFHMYLHANPFGRGSGVDGDAAARQLLVLARQIVGEEIVEGIEVAWSRVPVPPAPSVFGNNSGVGCRSG